MTCAISGKKAKYLDPMTKMTYATKDAFKILREKFYQSEEEKVGQRIQALNELLSLKKDKHKRHKGIKPDGNGDLPTSQNQTKMHLKVHSMMKQFTPLNNIPAVPPKTPEVVTEKKVEILNTTPAPTVETPATIPIKI